jgi:hypothetical protein
VNTETRQKYITPVDIGISDAVAENANRLVLTLLENHIVQLILAKTPRTTNSQLLGAVPDSEHERQKLENTHQDRKWSFRFNIKGH